MLEFLSSLLLQISGLILVKREDQLAGQSQAMRQRVVEETGEKEMAVKMVVNQPQLFAS